MASEFINLSINLSNPSSVVKVTFVMIEESELSQQRNLILCLH